MEVVPGAALGVALQQLRDSIVRAIAEATKFKFKLQLLKTTVDLLIERFNEMEQLCLQLKNKFPKAETERLRDLLEKGKNVISTCSHIAWWNYYRKRRYAKRIDELNQSLQHLLTFNFQLEQSTRLLEVLLKVNEMNKKLDRMENYGGVATDKKSSSNPGISSQPESSRSRFRLRYEKKSEKVLKCSIDL